MLVAAGIFRPADSGRTEYVLAGACASAGRAPGAVLLDSLLQHDRRCPLMPRPFYSARCDDSVLSRAASSDAVWETSRQIVERSPTKVSFRSGLLAVVARTGATS